MARSRRILVIDDDDGVRSTICENLGDAGLLVMGAHNGAHAMQMMHSYGAPDIVVTDMIMPDMEGLELVRCVKRQYPEVMIIAISGGPRMKMGDLLEIARKLGADMVFRKPVDMEKLEQAIHDLSCRPAS